MNQRYPDLRPLGRGYLLPALQTATVLLLLRQLYWTFFGAFNPDDFENLQIVWLLDRGFWPGRDYYHTHLPIYNFLLLPLYRAVGPTADLPGLTRLLLLPVFLLPLAQLHHLTRRLHGDAITPWLALPLFLASSFAARSLTESRPDALVFPLVLAGLAIANGYFYDPLARPRRLMLAALLLGASLLFNQKAGFIFLAVAWALERHHHRVLHWSWKSRLGRLVLFSLMLVLPLAICLAWLLATGRLVWPADRLLLASVAHYVSPHQIAHQAARLKGMALAGPVLLVCGLAGAWKGTRETAAEPSARQSALFLARSAALLNLLAVLLIPLTSPHMLVLPFLLLAPFAAAWLKKLAPGFALAVVLVAVGAGVWLDPHRLETRAPQWQRLQYLQAVVPADRPILDNISGLSLYHPPIGDFLHYRPLINDVPSWDEGTGAVIESLWSRRIGAVIKDASYPQMPAAVRRLIELQYEPSFYPDIWLPRKAVAVPDALR